MGAILAAIGWAFEFGWLIVEKGIVEKGIVEKYVWGRINLLYDSRNSIILVNNGYSDMFLNRYLYICK